jgi:thiamine kinase-like enzyme
VRTGAGDVVVKWERSARNVEREVEALRRYVPVLEDDAGQLLAADVDGHVLVLTHVPEVAAPIADLRSVRLVPAHRDYGPRNWLVDAAGHVRVIDFAHSEPSPWAVDLQKLTMREWRGRPELEAAFLEGYGRVPDGEDRFVLRAYVALSALATIAWSVAHDDPGFEAEARSVLAELVAG